MSLSQTSEIEVLTELGLAQRQAKVLLTLTRLGLSTANNVSKILKMPRQDTYKVLSELKQVGLIEKHLTKPAKYNALPIRDTLSILINRRNEELNNLKEKTEKIIQDFDRVSPFIANEADAQMILIPENEALLLRLLRATADAKQTIDIISSGKPTQRGYLLENAFENAILRSVKIRYISDNDSQINLQSEIQQKVLGSKLFERRIMRNRPVARIRIFDKKEIFVTLFPYADFSKSPALWSNNASFIELFQDYFENVWQTSGPIK